MGYLWMHFTLLGYEVMMIVPLCPMNGVNFSWSFLCTLSKTYWLNSVGVRHVSSSSFWAFFHSFVNKLHLVLGLNALFFVFFGSCELEIWHFHLLMNLIIERLVILVNFLHFTKVAFILWFVICFLVVKRWCVLFGSLVVFVQDLVV